jgi:phosphohistidine phosphatase
MEIYLMQHGESYPKDKDPERSLTPRGDEQIHLSAKALRKMGISFDLIISSPKQRAQQTAGIVADELGYPQGEIEVSAALEPTAPAEQVLLFLTSFSLKNSVLLAGHLPSLGEIASSLMSDAFRIPLRFEMGGVVMIDAKDPKAHSGELRWFLLPHQLELLSRV